jgi:hypothetical protein
MIAAPVQGDVDGVPKGSHFARVPPTGQTSGTKAADEILDKVARGRATLDRITKSATHH